jgi:threonyl-tRNA synthetase
MIVRIGGILKRISKKSPKEVFDELDLSLNEYVGFMDEDGNLFDLHEKETDFMLLVNKNSPEGLSIIRHTGAHILAQAVRNIYRKVEFGIGPATKDGFFYDINMSHRITPDDFDAIEKEMRRIVAANMPLKKFYPKDYKEYVKDGIKDEIVAGIEGEVSLYKQCKCENDNKCACDDVFIDVCCGPHLLSTGLFPDAFKIYNVSEVEFKNHKMQRISVYSFEDEEALKEHLEFIRLAEEYDHRKLGQQIGLFIQNKHGIFWLPKGVKYQNKVFDYFRKIYGSDYYEVKTAHVYNRELFEKTGHLPKYENNMFIMDDFVMKPMNCPAHIVIFNSESRSYRDLPFRIVEFALVFRKEEQGALLGLKRRREFIQDDCHIFCSLQQIEDEIHRSYKMLRKVYKDFGFEEIKVFLSTKPEKSIGEEKDWNEASNILKKVLEDLNIPYEINEGEGAFYGPKLEFIIRDNLKREWQCGTIQVDFFLPKRLDAYYLDSDGEKQVPVMLHRAIFGSIDRFTAVLLESNRGHLPFWCSPLQVVILPIKDYHKEYCGAVLNVLKEMGIEAKIDDENETISKKIRGYIKERVPLIFIVGDNEVKDRTVSIRNEDKNQVVHLEYLKDYINALNDEENICC